MKNSTDNPVPAPPKEKGPIRFEAIIPLTIVAGGIALYFTLFFDLHLRHGLEYGATLANGAEVNIGDVNTSIWNTSMAIKNIAVTNPEQPERNRVQIGAVTFRMLGDALLRGKVVIDEASIVDIQIDTSRKKAGRVLPVKKTKEGEDYNKQLLARMKDKFSGNGLGDLAAIASGTDPKTQLGSMIGDLKSTAQIDTIQKTLDEKKEQWQTRIAALPKKEDFSAMQDRLKNVKLDNPKDIMQVRASLDELKSIRDDFDTKAKSVQETRTALSDDLNTLKSTFSELDDAIKADIRDLKARIRLPTLDVKTLSDALFGMDVLGKIQQARGYMDQARSYMPPKGQKQQPPPVHERQRGHNYVFGQPNSYPRFWLRKAMISSRSKETGNDLSGKINDLTTNPAIIGRPMVATIKGNFAQQGISGVKAELVIDHTTHTPVERLTMDINRYAVAGRSLVSNPNVSLGFANAEGSLNFAAELREDKVDVRMNNRFSNVALETNASSPVVREMINASVAGLNTVKLDAHVTGVWSQLDWKLSTNLADALEAGMRRYLQAKLDDAKARVDALVNEKINEPRKRLYARRDEIEEKLKSGLSERQAQIDKLRAELDGARDKLEEHLKGSLDTQKQKAKEGAKKLFNNLRNKF